MLNHIKCVCAHIKDIDFALRPLRRNGMSFYTLILDEAQNSLRLSWIEPPPMPCLYCVWLMNPLFTIFLSPRTKINKKQLVFLIHYAYSCSVRPGRGWAAEMKSTFAYECKEIFGRLLDFSRGKMSVNYIMIEDDVAMNCVQHSFQS